MKKATLSAFSVDKLMEETRRLARAFKHNTEKALPISNELGRFDAQKILQLQNPQQPEKGVDFIGTGELAGQKIQVKSRVVFNPGKSGLRVGKINEEGEWDTLLLIMYDDDYNPDEIFVAQKHALLTALKDKKPNKRGALSVAQFKVLGECIWQADAS